MITNPTTQASTKEHVSPVMGASKYQWQDYLVVNVARFYSDEYGKPFMAAVGKFEDYDIVSADGEISIEVKCETTPSRTGNVAIEFWNTDFDTASGILSTKANLWLHIVLEGGTFTGYEWEVGKLRKLSMEIGAVKAGGVNSLCKIIPLEQIRVGALRQFEVKGINFSSLFKKGEQRDLN